MAETPAKQGLPLVSIITPAYNAADYIVETVESVLAQDYPNLEYIVINDGSSDDTLAILRQFKDRARILTHDNRGEQATANPGRAGGPRRDRGHGQCGRPPAAGHGASGGRRPDRAARDIRSVSGLAEDRQPGQSHPGGQDPLTTT